MESAACRGDQGTREMASYSPTDVITEPALRRQETQSALLCDVCVRRDGGALPAPRDGRNSLFCPLGGSQVSPPPSNLIVCIFHSHSVKAFRGLSRFTAHGEVIGAPFHSRGGLSWESQALLGGSGWLGEGRGHWGI